MAKKTVAGKSNDDRKLLAFLGVFLMVIGFIIALAAKKNDKYVMYYGKQGLVLFIACVIIMAAGTILWSIPVLGGLIMSLSYIGVIVLWVVGLINSLSGEMKPVPVMGHFANKIKI